MVSRSEAKKSINALPHKRSGCDMHLSFRAENFQMKPIGKRSAFWWDKDGEINFWECPGGFWME
jgi:hypothetical protein